MCTHYHSHDIFRNKNAYGEEIKKWKASEIGDMTGSTLTYIFLQIMCADRAPRPHSGRC